MIVDPRDQQVAEVVAKHCWSCQSVSDGDPAFAYSVGFPGTLSAPEFIVFGLAPELMHRILWGVFRQISAGAPAIEGARWSDLIDGYECVTIGVHPNRALEYLGFAQGHHRYCKRDGIVSALQLVWPGKAEGLFPWQEGCHQDVKRLQPRLDTPERRGWTNA
jgi:hypothetical protein